MLQRIELDFICRCLGVFTLLVICNNSIFSQPPNILTGSIYDKKYDVLVEFANVIGHGSGAVTDTSGLFVLNPKLHFLTDTIIVTHLSYNTLKIPVRELGKNRKIFLEPKAVKLDEISVVAKNKKLKRIGGQSKSTKMYGAIVGDELELATKINVKSKSKLLDMNVNFLKIISDSVTVRVNLYNLKKGFPSDKIIKDAIFFTVTKYSTGTAIDLRPYNIIVDGDIIVGLKIMKSYGKQQRGFLVSCAVDPGGASYIYKKTGWERKKFITLAYNLLTEQL